MIRTRRAAAALAVVGGVVAVTSCGATAHDAASVDGTAISIDDFDQFAEGVGQLEQLAESYDAETGAMVPETAQFLLTVLISNEVADQVLAANGEAITAADRDTALAQAPPDDPVVGLPEDVRNEIVDSQAQLAAFERIQLGPDDFEAAYANGPVDLGVFCVRHILTETRRAADAVVAELEGGADFAELAQTESIDPSAAANGGTLSSQTGEPCMPAGEAAQTFDVTFYEAATAGVPGSIVGPVETQFGYHVVEAVPYADAAASIESLFAQYGGSLLLDGAIRSADISVDPRYGVWDPVALSVVAAR